MTRVTAGAIAVALLVLCRGALADVELPARTGFVVDAAEVIGRNQVQPLQKQMDVIKRRSGVELLVVTVPSLQGATIEAWGRAVLANWRVGGPHAVGAILIVAPNDRQVRIEVGAGLTTMLTDGEAAAIIDTDILPRLKVGDMSGGILAGINAIVDQVMPPMAVQAEPMAPSTSAGNTTAKWRAITDFPEQTGYVTDVAKVLDAGQAKSLNGELEALERRTGAEIAVVILPSLQDFAIEQWGHSLNQVWYVGGRDAIGATLVVAATERQAYIAVGSGLRRALTAPTVAAIVDSRIGSRMDAGDMAAGIVDGVEAMVSAVTTRIGVTGEPPPVESSSSLPIDWPQPKSESWAAAIDWRLVDLVLTALVVIGSAFLILWWLNRGLRDRKAAKTGNMPVVRRRAR